MSLLPCRTASGHNYVPLKTRTVARRLRPRSMYWSPSSLVLTSPSAAAVSFPFFCFLLGCAWGQGHEDRCWSIGATRVKTVVLAFGFSDFAVDFFGFFTTSSSDALWCALSLTSPSSSLGGLRFGIIGKTRGAVDQIRGNIARRQTTVQISQTPFTTHGDHQSTPIASVSGRHYPTSTPRSEFFHSPVEE